MIQNSSFFWASDDIRLHGDDDGDATDEPTTTSSDQETVEINPLSTKTYGALFVDHATDHQARSVSTNTRRKLFDLSSGDSKKTVQKQHNAIKSIRFQVVVWHIGTIDVCKATVEMKFRVTMFWELEDSKGSEQKNVDNNNNKKSSDDGTYWVMQGRQRAYRKIIHDETTVKEIIDVPPVSILNAIELETVGDPEVTMINHRTRTMRWSCMYNASIFQGAHLSVKNFPHDVHLIHVNLGILAHRGKGARWDYMQHRLELANEYDSQGTTRIPHGLVVDHCHIPDYGFDADELDFQFRPLMHGIGSRVDQRDVYLQVTLPVHRESGYYDGSILPMLVALNIIGITCLTRNFASATAATEIMLSIAFVQVGIRLTLDNRLPHVGYQIKMIKVMNNCFWLLSGLVLESNVVFFLVRKMGWDISSTNKLDLLTAGIAFVYNVYIVMMYYAGSDDGFAGQQIIKTS